MNFIGERILSADVIAVLLALLSEMSPSEEKRMVAVILAGVAPTREAGREALRRLVVDGDVEPRVQILTAFNLLRLGHHRAAAERLLDARLRDAATAESVVFLAQNSARDISDALMKRIEAAPLLFSGRDHRAIERLVAQLVSARAQKSGCEIRINGDVVQFPIEP